MLKGLLKLVTGIDGSVAPVTVFKAMPQILSAQIDPFSFRVGLLLFVAQGMVIQSLAQLVLVMLPMLNKLN